MVTGPKPGDETTGLQFVYDAWKRMSAVKNSGGTILATYRYNGLNHRVRKLLGSNPASPTAARDYYYNTAWQLLEAYADTSAVYPLDRYVWGVQYIDSPVIRFHDADTNGNFSSSQDDNELYYLHDANFNVTGLVSRADGGVLERYMYEPYGKVTVLDSGWGVDGDGASDVDNDLLYCGYRHDAESGLYHVRNRHYHPTMGRWTSRDSKTYRAGMNVLAYAVDSPVGFVDPYGFQATHPATCPCDAKRKADLEKELQAIAWNEYGRMMAWASAPFPTCGSIGIMWAAGGPAGILAEPAGWIAGLKPGFYYSALCHATTGIWDGVFGELRRGHDKDCKRAAEIYEELKKCDKK